MANLEIALFDLDGTIADSLPAMRSIYREFLNRHGHTGSEAEFDVLNGKTLREIVALLTENHTLRGSPEELLSRYQILIESRYPTEAVPDPDALDVLRSLSAMGLRLGIVTSGKGAPARRFLEHHRLLPFFEHVIASEDFRRGKPAPDPYLAALQRFGAGPASAFAVEDSSNGVTAARGAGLRTFHLRSAAQETDALPRLGEVVDAIARHRSPGRSAVLVPPEKPLVRLAGEEFPALPDALEEKVARLWSEERSKRPALHDGSLLSFLRRGPDGLEAQFAEYRDYWAQRRLPEVRSTLGIMPLAVNGLILSGKKVLFGRRSTGVGQYPGYFELPPSGSIPRERVGTDGSVDYTDQLLRELEEETGIHPESIVALTPIGMVFDVSERCCDIGLKMDATLDLDAHCRTFQGNLEYDHLFTVTLDDLPAFLRQNSSRIVPTSIVLLDAIEGRS